VASCLVYVPFQQRRLHQELDGVWNGGLRCIGAGITRSAGRLQHPHPGLSLKGEGASSDKRKQSAVYTEPF